jgi:hypothetical protein
LTALIALDTALRVGYRIGSLATPAAVCVLGPVVSMLSLVDTTLSLGEERQRWPDRERIQYAGKQAVCCHERMTSEGAQAVIFKTGTSVKEVDTAFGLSDLTTVWGTTS